MLDAIWKEASIFHNVLQSFRVRRGKSWTQKETAKLLGIEYRKYIGWENGESIPSREELKKIVAVFRLNQEEEEALYLAAWQAPPKICRLPFPPNPFFTGRKSYLKQIRQFLQENGSVALTQPVSISGLGGIGKTQLALAYAYSSYPKVYRAVLWVNATNKDTLQGSYVTLAQVLRLPEQDEREPGQIRQAVKQWLDDHTNWLLIMDNADDLELARSFFPTAHDGHILLTTRSQFSGKIGARQIEVDKMEPEEGQVFLLRRTDELKGAANIDSVASDIREPALQLVELLDGHPLALDQAGAYVAETGISLADYIQLYKEERLFLLASRDSDGNAEEHPETVEHPESVVATVRLSCIKAFERQPHALTVLYICSFFTTDTIPEELFQYIEGIEGFELDAKSFNKVIAVLRRYSLIKRNAQVKMLSIHRLVQAVLIDMLTPELRRKLSFIVYEAMIAIKPPSNLDPLKRELFYLELIYQYHIYLENAEDFLNALAFQRVMYGHSDPRTELTRQDFAAFLRRIGRHAEAAALDEDNLDPARKFVLETKSLDKQRFGSDRQVLLNEPPEPPI